MTTPRAETSTPTRTVIAAATGEPLAEVAESASVEVDRAVEAASAAFEREWRRVPPRARGALLGRLAASVGEHADELARIESANVGKPLREARLRDVASAVRVLEYYAGWSDKLGGATIPHSALPVLNYTTRAPYGVVGAIVPWNFPLALLVWKLAPALAAGNVLVAKPSELTPLSALRLAELAEGAGFPPGVFTVVTGAAEAGAALCRHPGVAKLTFTGSTATGRSVMAAAAGTLKPLTLECGGKSACIVFADADLERAVDAILAGIFTNQGEICAAGSRLLVQREVRDELVARLVTRTEELVVGDPSNAETDIGALVSHPHAERVDAYVRSAVEDGGTVLTGGRLVEVDGFSGAFYEPTVVVGVDPAARVAQEEVFGPVLVVLPFDDEDDAVRIANATAYGLVANIHTRDLRRAHTVADRLACGTVFVNMGPASPVEAPIGGWKQSGFGKDLGREALDGYLRTKSVLIDLAPEGQHPRWFASRPTASGSEPG